MSAHDNPVWGLAAGRFSTLMARTGRCGTPLGRSTPESGHTAGGDGEVDAEGFEPLGLFASGPTPALPPSARTAAAPPPTSNSATTTPSVARPRLVGVMLGISSLNGRGEAP